MLAVASAECLKNLYRKDETMKFFPFEFVEKLYFFLSYWINYLKKTHSTEFFNIFLMFFLAKTASIEALL